MQPVEPVPVTTKTPISLLQELCVRRSITPKYDLMSIEGAVHEPTFVYRVSVDALVATGTGHSKKKAKHNAAKSALDKVLNMSGFAPGGQVGETVADDSVATNNGFVLPAEDTKKKKQVMNCSYEDGIPGNPVGQLQELCMNRHWPPPIYTLTCQEGLPHNKNFTMSCTVGKFIEPGEGKSKKLAKRQASFRLMEKLKEIPVNNSNDVLDEDLYTNLKNTHVNSLTQAHSHKIGNFHRQLRNSNGVQINKLQTTPLNGANVKYVDILHAIAQEENFEVTYVDIEENSLRGRKQCLVQLSTFPVAVCYGVGKASVDAQSDAAHSALEYLKIMTKK